MSATRINIKENLMARSKPPDDDFEKLLRACLEFSMLFPDGVVFIGGIAVYLHAMNHEKTRALAEATHDADFYISLADMADLRDIEEVTANRRLNKHQLIKNGFEFDIYTERHSALIVPYDQIMAYSIVHDQMRLSSLEHLLILKLEAFRDRERSSKGQKDAKDLIRISLILTGTRSRIQRDLIFPFLSEDHLKALDRIARGPEFLSLAKGNAKEAKEMRTQFHLLTGLLHQGI
ncbi:MAG: hypothetical protein SFY92_02695 [Verrucomicrobiae bacterium]|nr:hypothetical protein [Verrucomicrobiae bacterium]